MAALMLAPSPVVAGERAPLLAGTWYPGGRAELYQWMEKALDHAGEPENGGRLVALAAPHAGYVYSGPTAARAFKQAQNRAIDTAVVIAPSHRAAFPGVSVYDQGAYKTPLGTMALDMDFIAALKEADSDVRYLPQAHAREHAVEIQVPFIQTVLPRARLVPLVMGDQHPDTCRKLAAALARIARGKRVLIVASTDLSHFHNAAQAKELDGVLAGAVAAFDVDALFSCLSSGACEACGGGPLAVAMLAAKDLGANRAEVLEYSHSGMASGDNGRVVGYLAAAFFQDGKGGSEDEAAGEFGPKDRADLHAIAHESIATALEGKRFAPPKDLSPLLVEERGAFVTLKKHGDLRGCIGNVIATRPLHETVAAMARAAAFQDPRFPGLRPEEFKDVEIEISVLSVPEPLEDPARVEVGKHGLIMQRGMRSGLLLPQVPGEWGWDRETFLNQTCRKSGLEPECWKNPDTRIWTFTAEVF